MKTIKAKNGEWVNLSNHLPKLTKVENKQFAIAVADNILKLRESLKHLDGILAATP
jgi:glutaminase